jgi:two-component system, response regulator YesN
MRAKMYTVMIVDDMEIMRRQIRRLPLWGESTGFSIASEAMDGQDALEKLEIQAVDLLLTDISMPRINGIELLKEVQERSLASCVVFLSEHSEFNFAKDAIQYGIFDYLVKPVNQEGLQNLLDKVKKHIEQKKMTYLHIKNLEDKLTESIDVYYPTTQINSIIQRIVSGDKNALDTVETMVNETSEAMNYDRLKTALMLQRAYDEIYATIKASQGWIEQFLDLNPFEDLSLSYYNTIEEMKKKIIQNIESLVLIINKFILRSKKSHLVTEICHYCINNVEAEISMGKISETLFLTKNYIGDLFKQETGITVGEYITLVKMERAKKLIAEDTLRSYEIAYRLGYSNAEYFGKLFKKHTGLSPLEFKTTLKD